MELTLPFPIGMTHFPGWLQFGMAPVYATVIGLTPAEISVFVGAFYVGGLLLQYPIGWLSDRMDRRALIAITTAFGAAGCLVALIFGDSFIALVVTAVLIAVIINELAGPSLARSVLSRAGEIEE